MNIKYRLLCKRLIEERKRVGVIQYYNVLFIMELLSDKDIWSLEQWVNGINNIYICHVIECIILHQIHNSSPNFFSFVFSGIKVFT